MAKNENVSSGSLFAPEALAKLWPNRVHESNWVKNWACHFGLHRWQEMKFEDSQSAQLVRFCRWCARIKTL
jgi:hypothetical protein